MSIAAPLETIPLGVIVERSKSAGPWTDFVWRPTAVLTGVPETPPWTVLTQDDGRVSFYAGAARVELYRSESAHYRDNLLAEPPLVWVALPEGDGDPPFGAPSVTADPAEGEAWAGTPGLLVDSVTMPPAVAETIAAFVAEHFVDHDFSKRRRDRADPEALGRRTPRQRRNDKPDAGHE